ACRPYDYWRISGSSDCLVVVSYSGATSDCGLAIQQALRKDVPRIALVSGVSSPKLAELLRPGRDVIVSYSDLPIPRERGFISMAGTVIPCEVWAAAIVKSEAMLRFAHEIELNENNGQEDIDKLACTLEQNTVVHVFGGGLAWAAMLDLESKLVEGGIG